MGEVDLLTEVISTTNQIRSRIFIVGCPRSGTTFLQSLLAAHPEIISFPETHFFSHLYSSIRIFRLLKIASRGAKQRSYQFLRDIGQDELRQCIPYFSLFGGGYADGFVKILDTLTVKEGGSLWIEKTPGHLHFIKQIEKLVKDTRFIHIIRTGADVVASLFEVTRKYPHQWGGPRDLKRCVNRWIVDIEITQKHLYKSNHTLVRYENLIKDPEKVLSSLCAFIGVPASKRMLKEYKVESKQLILIDEKWKEKVNGNIQNAQSDKFYTIFNKEQRQYILKRLSESGIDKSDLRPRISPLYLAPHP